MASSPFAQCDRCGAAVVNLREHQRRAHGIEPTVRQRECAYCGDTFARDHSDQDYCSQQCAERAKQRGGSNV